MMRRGLQGILRDGPGIRSRQWLRAALLVAWLGSAAGAQAPARAAAARQPLDVMVEDAADVWSRADGTGYANDIVRAAFRAGGIEPRLFTVPYARCKALVSAGLAAACFSMSRDASIPASVVFADSANFTFSSDFYQNVHRPLHLVHGVPRRGALVGVVRGYEYPDTLARLERLGIIRLVSAGSEETNLHKLVDGRLDAVMLNTDATKTAAQLLARMGMQERVSFALRGGTLPAFVGFSRRHPLGPEALARFNAGRRLIAANGELAAIRRRWADSVAAMQRAPRRALPPGGSPR